MPTPPCRRPLAGLALALAALPSSAAAAPTSAPAPEPAPASPVPAAAPLSADDAAIAASLSAPRAEPSTERPWSPLEIPPPPPRHKGVVLETTLGAMGWLGKLKTISPPASLLHLQLGYEPFDWLLVFGEGDLGFTSTRYASPPPGPRGYAVYGFGAGLRGTVHVTDRVALYAQFDFGGMKANTDVLASYGFTEAEKMNAYFGGTGGVEWYQVDRHYALALNGGARRTTGFDRLGFGGDSAVAWMGGAAIRYTF